MVLRFWKWTDKVTPGGKVEVTMRGMNINPDDIAEYESEVYLQDKACNVVARSGIFRVKNIYPSSYKDITVTLQVPSTATVGTVYNLYALTDWYLGGAFMDTEWDEIVDAVEVTEEKKVSWKTYAIIGGVGVAAAIAAIILAKR